MRRLRVASAGSGGHGVRRDPHAQGLDPGRRHLLCCTLGLAAGLFTGLVPGAARAFGTGCRPDAAGRWADDVLVQSAFAGVDARRLVDTHAHLLGTGDSGSGCAVHPSLSQWWQPIEVLRRRAILDASCVADDAPSVDRAFVERLQALTHDFPAGARWWLFAFENAHDDEGRPRPDWSTFHVPDEYAAAVAGALPARFAWVASIHPYRGDALERLDAAARGGAVAVKWLPSAMNIDLRDRRCRPFFERLVRHALPLVVHCGEEKAAPGARREALGNPLLLRAPLALGVTTIAAHCASLGRAHDLDQAGQPERTAFELFARVMDEANGRRHLIGDLSGLFQRNRSEDAWRTVLRREDWHARLVHGSDHPLPGVKLLYSTARLVRAGLLDAADEEPLAQLRAHNPLLFDFVLKRRLRLGAVRLPASIFEGQALARTPTHRRMS